MKKEYIVSSCTGIAISVKKGEYVTIIDIDGGQVVDFFAINADSKEEYLSTGVTIDCNESLHIGKGDIIYTNLYNPMFQIVYDDVEEHDLIHPCCRKEMYDFFYHNGKGHANCLDNINNSLKEKRSMINPFNIFMHTAIMPNGKIQVLEPISKSGDKIVLKAEMDVRIGVAACSVSESKCNNYRCTSIKVIVSDDLT